MENMSDNELVNKIRELLDILKEANNQDILQVIIIIKQSMIFLETQLSEIQE